MTKQEKIDAMNTICSKVGCNEEQRKRHIALFLDGWNVHPSKRFRAWWEKHPDCIESKRISGDGVSAVTAQNCQNYWDQYLEAKRLGTDQQQQRERIPATPERQKQYWHDLKGLLSLISSGASPERIKPLVDELNEKYPGYDPT